jgi:DNA-binding XRE family transcriptional regulator
MAERMEIAELISIRTTLKMNRTDLAAAIGVHPTSVDQWENGRRPVPKDRAWMIRSLYNRKTAAPAAFVHQSQAHQELARRLIEEPFEDLPAAAEAPPGRTRRHDLCLYASAFSFALVISFVWFVYWAWSDLDSVVIVMLLSAVPPCFVSGCFLGACAQLSWDTIPLASSRR